MLLTADGRVFGDADELARETRLDGALSLDDAAPEERPAPCAPLYVPSETLSGLNAFALRTTVPASDASRAGAGATAGDND